MTGLAVDHVDLSNATACSVHGHDPVEVSNAGASPQFGICLRCGDALKPAYTVDAHDVAAALALPPSPKNRGITA